VQRYNPVTLYGDQFVAWNGYLWCFTDDDVMRSDDGINWVVDVDLRALNGDVNYTIETINYNATHLYVRYLYVLLRTRRRRQLVGVDMYDSCWRHIAGRLCLLR
jgi:hypothetical protein